MSSGEKYVAAAYLVVFVVVLLYLVIMALKLQRLQRDLAQLAEQAIGSGDDVIGMAGGDGSQALVAGLASRHGIPMVVIPAGTRNHFALDIGLDRMDVVGALDAYTHTLERRVDLAMVEDRVFVNNASMGIYARIVQSPGYRDAKIQTTAAMLPEMLGPKAEPFGSVPAAGRGRRHWQGRLQQLAGPGGQPRS